MEKKNTVISIKTYASLKARLQIIAKHKRRSLASLIEMFLESKIQIWEKKNGAIDADKLVE